MTQAKMTTLKDIGTAKIGVTVAKKMTKYSSQTDKAEFLIQRQVKINHDAEGINGPPIFCLIV